MRDYFKAGKAADKIDMNKTLAYLEYDSARGKVEKEYEEAFSEERGKIGPEMNEQARTELVDIYGKEFTSDLFYEAVEETDELLNGKVIARVEEIKVKADISTDKIR